MPAAADRLLALEGVETSYGTSKVLFGMSLAVAHGTCVSLMGRNGMGKTTTIKSIMGVQRPQAGAVMFEGLRIDRDRVYRIARRGIAVVPEGRMIFVNLNVRENLVATRANRSDGPAKWTLDAVFDLFPALAARRSSLGGTLSGGEQQMLAIGRALMTNPKLLILDEATEGLAPLVREEIWNVLQILKDAGQSILIVDKNVSALAGFCDRHYVVEKGRVVWEGNSDQLHDDKDRIGGYVGI